MELGKYGTLNNVSREELKMLRTIARNAGIIIRATVYHGATDSYDVQFINPYKDNSIFDHSGNVSRLAKNELSQFYPEA